MSDTSTVTMSIDNLKIMSKTIILAEKLDASEVAALCMVTLLRDQIYNYHGQRHGYDFHKEKRTVLFRIANLLLFHAPIKHYKIWVDRITFRSQQDAVVEQIICELNLSNGMATALLAVNMAFLAIPSVDEMGAHQQLAVTKVLICFSVAASMGSIVVGLFLIGHHTALKHANTDAVARLNIGPCLERLAIAYSVPHALLMWGMITFLASFLCMCLEALNSRSVKVSVVVAYLFITAISSWCIFLVEGGSDEWTEQFLESQRGFLSDTMNSLRIIFSRENLCRLRDMARRTNPRTGIILPTTAM